MTDQDLAFAGREGAVEATFARDHNAFGEVAKRWIGWASERTPRATPAGADGLAPHDLAAQQQAEAVLQDSGDVCRQ